MTIFGTVGEQQICIKAAVKQMLFVSFRELALGVMLEMRLIFRAQTVERIDL
jgi:hypothetical protein